MTATMTTDKGPAAVLSASGSDVGRVGCNFLRYLRAQNRSPATLDSYGWALVRFVRSPFITGKALCGLTRDDLDAYFDQLWTATKPRSVLFHHKNLRAFLRWCIRQGIIDTSPMAGIPEPRCKLEAIEPYTETEIKALFTAAGHTSKPHRDTAALAVFLTTGVRLSELTRIRHEDVQGDRIRIRGKTGERWVGLTPQTALLLRTHLSTDGRYPTVFGTLNSRTLYQMVRRLGRATGIPHVHPHKFRNTFGVRFLENGGGIGDLQTLMGHARVEQTLRYVMYGMQERAIAGQMKFAPVIPVNGAGL